MRKSHGKLIGHIEGDATRFKMSGVLSEETARMIGKEFEATWEMQIRNSHPHLLPPPRLKTIILTIHLP